MRVTVAQAGGFGCFLYLLIFALYVTISTICFKYVLWMWFGKVVPTWAAIICGLITGEVVLPAALVTWILEIAGVIVR